MLILCPTLADAEREYAHLQGVIADLGLTLNASKSRIGATRDGFDFLGFSFRRGVYTRHGQRREMMIKVPRAKAEKAMRVKLKEQVKGLRLGEPLDATVQALNRRLCGWVQYFRIGNLRPALAGLVRYAGEQLRLWLRRRYQRKGSQYTQRWPDAFFHQTYGLYTVANLLNRR
jgi:RNA-directed DNA polymerase